MEESCKWIMVRRESTFDKIKKFFKNHFFNWVTKRRTERLKKDFIDVQDIPSKEKGEIIIEIIK